MPVTYTLNRSYRIPGFAPTDKKADDFTAIRETIKVIDTDVNSILQSLGLKADYSALVNLRNQLVGGDGKLVAGVLPALAITDTYPVNSQAEMLALTAEKGDVAIRDDIETSFILRGTDPSILENWHVLKSPSNNANTALKLALARTISLTGDAAGSVSFDGSANVSMVVTVNKLSTPRVISLTGDASGSASFDGSGNVAIAVALKGEVTGNLGNLSGATAINYANGTYQYGTIVAATSLSITNVPNDGRAYGLTLEITNGGANVSWPGNIVWLSGSAPTLKASGVNIITLVSRDGGTTWLGSSS